MGKIEIQNLKNSEVPTDARNACSYDFIINNMRSMHRAPSCREHIAVPAFKRHCLRTANKKHRQKSIYFPFLEGGDYFNDINTLFIHFPKNPPDD